MHLDPASPRAAPLIFSVFFIVGLLVLLPNIAAPFYWDDLHLVRLHSPQELASGWTGNWDPDGAESPGFRPLAMYFENFRAFLFGETTWAHRAFLVALFALFLTLVGQLTRFLFATARWEIVLGGLLGFVHVDSAYHYVWITDGIYLIPAILILGAIVTLLRWLGSRRTVWLLASYILTTAGMLMREDSLVAYPLLLWIGLSFVLLHRREEQPVIVPLRALAVYVVGMLGTAASFLYLRHLVVPAAPSLNVDPGALLWGLAQTLQNMGDQGKLAAPWPRYDLLITLWRLWLAALALMALLVMRRRLLAEVTVWAGALLLSLFPTMVVARVNVLLLPVTFWGFLAASTLSAFWSRFRMPLCRSLCAAMIVFALAGPTYGSYVFARDIRVSSLDWIATSATMLYGLHGQVTIPEGRREAVQSALSAYGISNRDDYSLRWSRLNRRALADQLYGLNPYGFPFIPRFNFMPAYAVSVCCSAFVPGTPVP